MHETTYVGVGLQILEGAGVCDLGRSFLTTLDASSMR
jgi:hypothetical protein